MKLLLIVSIALLVATAAFAGTFSYGWEDGTGTILGFFGNIGSATNVSSPVNNGARALWLVEDPIGGTPQAYVAFIEGCQTGDIIDGTFWAYDDTPGASPSGRIWAHYANSGDVNSYDGSLSGNGAYSGDALWSPLSWTWSFDAAASISGTADAMVIEARIYSGAAGTGLDYLGVDDIEVTIPEHCTVTFPGEDPTSTEETTWGSVKSLFR